MIFITFIIFALLTISHCAEEVKTVNCGSAIRLFHGENPSFYLSSGPYRWTTGSNHQVVTLTQEFSSPSSLWQIPSSSHCETGNPVNCGDTIRLMEIETKKFLYTDSTFPSVLSRRDQEISAFGDDDGESKSPENNDWKVICTGTSWTVDQRVQLYHISSETYLMSSKEYKFTEDNCRQCPIIGHFEVSATNHVNHLTVFKADQAGVHISL